MLPAMELAMQLAIQRLLHLIQASQLVVQQLQHGLLVGLLRGQPVVQLTIQRLLHTRLVGQLLQRILQHIQLRGELVLP